MTTIEDVLATVFDPAHETLVWQDRPTSPGFWWYRSLGARTISGPAPVWSVEQSGTLWIDGTPLAAGLYTFDQQGNWRRCDGPNTQLMLRQWAGPIPRPPS